MARRIAFSSMIVIVLSLVGCDHATKLVAASQLSRSEPMAIVPGLLELKYVENQDTAFSLTRDLDARVKVPLLALAGALGLLGVGVVVRRKFAQAGTAERVALAMLAAGAIGNVVERLRRGYVVDFIYVHHWPVFNVADIFIVVGAAWLAFEVAYAARVKAA